jgi:LmbE family N-acetylglucosaminyl deacetylase
VLLVGAVAWVLSALMSADSATDPPPVHNLELTVSTATRLMVVAPHPDDESLAAAGLIQRVLSAGGDVRVVLMTSGDGFAEGVETADGISHPRPRDYRNYGKVREQESLAAMEALNGSPRVSFLGFPDAGLCQIAARYLETRRAFESPYTDRSSPVPSEQLVPGVRYRGEDIRREIERVLMEFTPTLLAIPHCEDEHPDHCATTIFVDEALATLAKAGLQQPRVLHYIVHYGRWPLDADPGSQLTVPAAFAADQGRWESLALTTEESEAKKRAVLAYRTQLLVIGRFLLAFARSNELFIEGDPASAPECWCDDDTVATDLPPSKRRHDPKIKP